MRARMVVTRPDGGVAIVSPSANAVRWMATGGRWGNPTRGWLDEQLRRSVAAGHNEAAAHRFICAMQWGGCTTAEALAIIRDRDCLHLGTACELCDIADLPTDRTYRNAWRRSHNGGPIWIDEHKAMVIDEARAWAAYEAMNGRS